MVYSNEIAFLYLYLGGDNIMGLGSIGVPELLIILLVVLLLFGAKRLPELARGLGKGIREFKNASKQVENEFKELEKGEEEESSKKKS
jgi:sec-independent protein translocase protein TatA